MKDVKKNIDSIVKNVLTKGLLGDLHQIDSVEFVDLMLTIENEFKINLTENELLGIRSNQELELLVKKKLQLNP